MKFYQEITIIPNHEIGANFIWSKLYTQIHLGLVEVKNDQNQSPIGVSFPEYLGDKKGVVLGNKLRLFAEDEAALVKFDAVKWLSRLSDYVHCTGVRAVQKVNGYATYQRYQPKTNKERLARRAAKRAEEWRNKGDAASLAKLAKREEALRASNYNSSAEYYEDMKHKKIAMPYINLKSLGGGESFCLWIKKTPANQPSNEKAFSSYGLSSSSTVPEF